MGYGINYPGMKLERERKDPRNLAALAKSLTKNPLRRLVVEAATAMLKVHKEAKLEVHPEVQFEVHL